MLKIIAGKYKNRHLPILKKAKYRPSTSRMREAIFSILTSGEFIQPTLFHDIEENIDFESELNHNNLIDNILEKKEEISEEKDQYIKRNLPGKNSILWESEVLDLYAGTGSLAFEALSRGAKSATLIDISPDYLQAAKQFAVLINETENTKFLCLDALNLPKAYKSFDIIFMDPPYYQRLADRTIKGLIKGGWLKNGSLIVVELAKTEDIADQAGLKLIKRRVYGNNKLLIFQYN